MSTFFRSLMRHGFLRPMRISPPQKEIEDYGREHQAMLTRYRERAGLTQHALGVGLGVTDAYIVQLEEKQGQVLQEQYVDKFCSTVKLSPDEALSFDLIRKAAQGDEFAMHRLTERAVKISWRPHGGKIVAWGVCVALVIGYGIVLQGNSVWGNMYQDSQPSLLPVTPPLAHATVIIPIPVVVPYIASSPSPDANGTKPQDSPIPPLTSIPVTPTRLVSDIPPDNSNTNQRTRSPAPTATKEPNFDRSAIIAWKDMADQLYRDEDYAKSLEYYQQILAANMPTLTIEHPDLFFYVNVYISVCNIYFKQRDYNNTLLYCNNVIKYTPDVTGNYGVIGNAYIIIGYTYYFLSDYNSSIDTFSKVIQLMEKDSVGYYGLAINFIETNAISEAKNNFQRCIDENSDQTIVAECRLLLAGLVNR
ncbi:helix-turn-helix domain-containing protein [Herpetosiphon gulosus]|uniref:HTH cro/C1-type domain-containing protein n=1 Tax=Herpetosiphon gulosus TaxID=1973496 RepID=A0ABP9X6P4_9CHLR